MSNWYQHWNSPALQTLDPVHQVGKTVKGEPIPEQLLQTIAREIAAKLSIRPTDHVLDLCCGNGLITSLVAPACQLITGIDYSEPLINTARDRFQRENITYVLADVTAVPHSILDSKIDKVYMYEALQHFTTEAAGRLLNNLQARALRSAPVLLAGIPDADQIWAFYNTPDRRADYYRRLEAGTEAIGHWWTQTDIIQLARDCGYQAAIRPQDPALHTSHYRFDALLIPVAV